MAGIERYRAFTCDNQGNDFEGRGMAFTLAGIRLEISLTRREAPQARLRVAAPAAKPSEPDGSRPASEGASK